MSPMSKQKEGKQPFEQQLSYISECISFKWQEGLNTNIEQCELLRYFCAAVRKGFLVLPRCDDTLMNIWLTEILIHRSSNLLF